MGVTTAFVKFVKARLLWNLTRYLMKHFIMHLILKDYYASDYFCNHKQEGIENLNFILWFIVSRAQEKSLRNFVRQCCLLISCRNLYRDLSQEVYLGKRLGHENPRGRYFGHCYAGTWRHGAHTQPCLKFFGTQKCYPV